MVLRPHLAGLAGSAAFANRAVDRAERIVAMNRACRSSAGAGALEPSLYQNVLRKNGVVDAVEQLASEDDTPREAQYLAKRTMAMTRPFGCPCAQGDG